MRRLQKKWGGSREKKKGRLWRKNGGPEDVDSVVHSGIIGKSLSYLFSLMVHIISNREIKAKLLNRIIIAQII